MFFKLDLSIPSIWFVAISTISTNIHISSLEDLQVTSASLLWAKLLICWYYLKNIYLKNIVFEPSIWFVANSTISTNIHIQEAVPGTMLCWFSPNLYCLKLKLSRLWLNVASFML